MYLSYRWVILFSGYFFETSICLLCAMIIMMRIDHSFILMIVYMYHYCSYPKIDCPFTEEILVLFYGVWLFNSYCIICWYSCFISFVSFFFINFDQECIEMKFIKLLKSNIIRGVHVCIQKVPILDHRCLFLFFFISCLSCCQYMHI